MPFRARFDTVASELVFVPSETGIERRVNAKEWQRFVARFNEVERAGYNPLRPGHYPKITFNSSYLVTIAESASLNRISDSAGRRAAGEEGADRPDSSTPRRGRGSS